MTLHMDPNFADTIQCFGILVFIAFCFWVNRRGGRNDPD